jgi:hypothetical protein
VGNGEWGPFSFALLKESIKDGVCNLKNEDKETVASPLLPTFYLSL